MCEIFYYFFFFKQKNNSSLFPLKFQQSDYFFYCVSYWPQVLVYNIKEDYGNIPMLLSPQKDHSTLILFLSVLVLGTHNDILKAKGLIVTSLALFSSRVPETFPRVHWKMHYAFSRVIITTWHWNISLSLSITWADLFLI